MAGVEAPWTDRQVRRIREWQQNPHAHPLTCGKRDDHTQRDRVHDDWGVLKVCGDFLYCAEPGCDYVQYWVPAMCVAPAPSSTSYPSTP